VLRENIARMQAFADGHDVALRPHAKTHKSVDIARMQVAAGARGITVSDLQQAEVFAADGITDIFLAFPLWVSVPKAARVRRLLETVDLTIGLDSRDAVDAIVERGLAGAARLGLVIELDCGGRRSGVAPDGPLQPRHLQP
jgi:D-serine deaminase-like pyridoxal phosphate-dependent protein